MTVPAPDSPLDHTLGRVRGVTRQPDRGRKEGEWDLFEPKAKVAQDLFLLIN